MAFHGVSMRPLVILTILAPPPGGGCYNAAYTLQQFAIMRDYGLIVGNIVACYIEGSLV